jgi:hypothetical protein
MDCLTTEDGTDRLYRNVGKPTTNPRCVTSKNNNWCNVLWLENNRLCDLITQSRMVSMYTNRFNIIKLLMFLQLDLFVCGFRINVRINRDYFLFILQSVLRQVRSLFILQSVLRQVRSLFILQSVLR